MVARYRGGIVLIALVAAVVAMVMGYRMTKAGPPDQSQLAGIIAKHENVKASEVDVLAYEVAHGEPVVLYHLTDQPFRYPNGSAMPEPLKLSYLVHPTNRPWKWTIGGGGYGSLPSGGAAASIGLLSASGDTGTYINTEIYGATVPQAAEIQLTVNGKRYTRDLRQSEGFIFLLPDQHVMPGEISDIRVLDASGRELPPPIAVGAPVKSPTPSS